MRVLINIDVDDLESAIDFYSALGLRLQRRFFGNSVAEMVGGGSTIHLLAKPSGTIASAASGASRDYRRHWTPIHLDFVVEDIDAAVRDAIGAGAILEREITSHAWGQLAAMSDPFGHGFCLLQFTDAGYDVALSW
jgi:predicted enzyme related to lactoylglutathione lyase